MARTVELVGGLATGVAALISFGVFLVAGAQPAGIFLILGVPVILTMLAAYRHSQSADAEAGRVWLRILWIATALLILSAVLGGPFASPEAVCALISAVAGSTVQNRRQDAARRG